MIKKDKKKVTNSIKRNNSSCDEWKLFFRPFLDLFCLKDVRKNVMLLLFFSIISSLSAYFFGAFIFAKQYWAFGVNLVVLGLAVSFGLKQIKIITNRANKQYLYLPFSFSLAQLLFAVVLPILISGIILFFVFRFESLIVYSHGNWVSLIPVLLINCFFAYLVIYHDFGIRGNSSE